MKDGDVSEEPHVKEAAKTEFRSPEPTMQRPTGARQGFGSPPATHLHHPNPVALFRQTMGGDAAAEALSDHDEIEIILTVAERHKHS